MNKHNSGFSEEDLTNVAFEDCDKQFINVRTDKIQNCNQIKDRDIEQRSQKFGIVFNENQLERQDLIDRRRKEQINDRKSKCIDYGTVNIITDHQSDNIENIESAQGRILTKTKKYSSVRMKTNFSEFFRNLRGVGEKDRKISAETNGVDRKKVDTIITLDTPNLAYENIDQVLHKNSSKASTSLSLAPTDVQIVRNCCDQNSNVDNKSQKCYTTPPPPYCQSDLKGKDYRKNDNNDNSNNGSNDKLSVQNFGLCPDSPTSFILKLFPILSAFNEYNFPNDLINDLMAGITMSVIHIPQGMAYGLLAGVEPVYGLYVSLIPVFLMSLMSQSARHVSYGTFAIVSVMLSSTVFSVQSAFDTPQSSVSVATVQDQGIIDSNEPSIDISTNILQISDDSKIQTDVENFLETPSPIEIVTTACLFIGLIQLAMAILRLGSLTQFFTDTLVSSFTTASAVQVLTAQLDSLFDIDMPRVHRGLFKILRIFIQWVNYLPNTNLCTATMTILSVIFLILIKELIEPWMKKRTNRLFLPTELLLIVATTSAVYAFDLNKNYGVKVLGDIPRGLPSPTLPRTDIIQYMIPDVFTIAIVSYAMNLSIIQIYAKKFNYFVDANYELASVGITNVISSMFSCFPCAVSLSRSSVQSTLDVKSPLATLCSCSILLTIILLLSPLLYYLPKSTMACIIMIALKNILFQFSDLFNSWKISKLDGLVWTVTFVAVMIFDVTLGLVIGLIVTISTLFLKK